MVEKTLTPKTLLRSGIKKMSQGILLHYEDVVDAVKTTGIVVDDAAYDTGTFKDRDYDVRAFQNFLIALENIGANEVKYKILSSTKDFSVLDTDLSDDDFDKEEKAETTIPAGVAAAGTIDITGGPSVKAEGDLTLVSAVANAFATGTATCASVEVGDTVTINGLVYTAIAGSKGGDNTKFSIDTGDNECATDLADSITNDTRNGTTGDQTATSSTNVVTITTDVLGTGGNAITLVSSNGSRLAVSGATFSGGVNADTVTVNGLVYKAVAGVKADNTEFSTDTSDNATATDLADSITNDSRTGTLDDVTATASTNVVTCTQTVGGTGGNSTTLTSTDGTTLAVSGATFTGGLEADTATVNGLVYKAVAGVKADNTEFSIDTGDTETATDLADSITNDSRTPITVPGIDVTATSSTAVVTVSAPINDGAAGNAIDLVGTSNITADNATLTGGVSSSMDSIKVDGQEILSGAVAYKDSVNQTATDIAANINAFTSNPNYTATASTDTVTITATVNEASTATVSSTTTVLTKTDSNMSGGADGKIAVYELVRNSPQITAIRLMAKESSAGSPGKIRADVKGWNR